MKIISELIRYQYKQYMLSAKYLMPLIALLTLLAVVRISVIDKFPVSKCVLWLIPPVSDVVSWFSNQEYFNMGKVIYAFALMMVYGIILAIVKTELLRKRGY